MKKVALVTGGGSGLGFAMAKKFTSQNITTIIAGRNTAKLQAACDALGENAYYITADLDDLASIPGMVQQIIAQHGHLDILVNNAGINLKKDMVEVTDAEFQKVINTNLTSVFVISREVAKHMLERKQGSIIHISSMASKYGIPKVIAYTASKAAIEGMTRAMAVELSPGGVRVNCVAPGFIATDMTATALNNDPERKQKVMGRTPMGKMGEPDDVAEAVYYLASDASAYVTGTILTVDGGNSIGF